MDLLGAMHLLSENGYAAVPKGNIVRLTAQHAMSMFDQQAIGPAKFADYMLDGLARDLAFAITKHPSIVIHQTNDVAEGRVVWSIPLNVVLPNG